MLIAAVAAAVGYQNRAAFAKLFKRLTGATPAAFRRQHGHAPLLVARQSEPRPSAR
jgi:AraC-like DNA-binding protein